MPLVIPAAGPDLGWMEQLCDPLGDDEIQHPVELPASGTVEAHVLAVNQQLAVVHRGMLPGLVHGVAPLELVQMARDVFWAPRSLDGWRIFTMLELRRACTLPPARRQLCFQCRGTGLRTTALPADTPRVVVAGETDPTQPGRTWDPVHARVLGLACPQCGGRLWYELRGDGYRNVGGVPCDARSLQSVVDHVDDHGDVVIAAVDRTCDPFIVCFKAADWRVRLAPVKCEHPVPELGAFT